MAETSTFVIFPGRNVRGQNVQAEMSVAETSKHRRAELPTYIVYFSI